MLHQLNLCHSWLLADPEMKVRSNYQGYQEAITQFFGNLLPRVADLQVGVCALLAMCCPEWPTCMCVCVCACVCFLGNPLPGVADLLVCVLLDFHSKPDKSV